MRFIVWFLRGVVFIALFGLAIKNSGVVELRFFFDQSWLTPLSLALLVAFVAGVAVGLTTLLVTLERQRREIAALKRTRQVE